MARAEALALRFRRAKAASSLSMGGDMAGGHFPGREYSDVDVKRCPAIQALMSEIL